MTMTLTCVCPTYRRPELLANAIGCFVAQTYPHRELIVLDDAGELEPRQENGWQIVSVPDRYPTLAAKYNALVDLAGDTDGIVVWEDDDIYLPWHLEAHAHALFSKGHVWSSPSRAWSLYTGQLAQEPGRRFHAAIAFRAGIVPGWPETGQPTFDQQLMARLNEQGKPGDPCAAYPPSYVFRWGSTGSYHGQAFMRGNDDTRWYHRAVEQTQPAIGRVSVNPGLDSETERVYGMLFWPGVGVCPSSMLKQDGSFRDVGQCDCSGPVKPDRPGDPYRHA